jgi:uncharacterized protein DUF6498
VGPSVKHLFDPSYWSAVARNPAAMVSLVADLAPIFAVVFWGWGAAPLIVLYWLENVVIGAFVVPRMIIAAVGRHGPLGLIGCVFGVPFFVFHYGMFCFVHGIFVLTMLHSLGEGPAVSTMGDLAGNLFQGALAFARHMDWMLIIIIAAHGVAFVWEFLIKGGWRDSTFDNEMGAPYGRIIILHFSIFFLGGALFLLGDPASGAVLLVLARAAWGLHTNMKPKKKPPEPAAPAPAAA